MKQDKLISLYKKHSGYSVPALTEDSKERIKLRIFQNLHTEPEHAKTRTGTTRTWSFSFVRFASFAVFILAVLSGTAYASGSSIPGDTLYPVKRAVEGARLSFASTAESKAKLQVQFTEERIRELNTIETKSVETKKVKNKPTLPLPTPSPVPAIAATGTTATTIAPDNQNDDATTHPEAETRARKEVLKALTRLEQTQKTLTEEGKQGEAKDLDATIVKLKNKVNVRSWRDSRRDNSDQKEKPATDNTNQKNVETDGNSGKTENDQSSIQMTSPFGQRRNR